MHNAIWRLVALIIKRNSNKLVATRTIHFTIGLEQISDCKQRVFDSKRHVMTPSFNSHVSTHQLHRYMPQQCPTVFSSTQNDNISFNYGTGRVPSCLAQFGDWLPSVNFWVILDARNTRFLDQTFWALFFIVQ